MIIVLRPGFLIQASCFVKFQCSYMMINPKKHGNRPINPTRTEKTNPSLFFRPTGKLFPPYPLPLSLKEVQPSFIEFLNFK